MGSVNQAWDSEGAYLRHGFCTRGVRIEPLAAEFEAASNKWSERLGLSLLSDAGYALQLGEAGLQFVELGVVRQARFGLISLRGR